MATPAPPHRAPRLVVLDPDPGRRRHLVDALAAAGHPGAGTAGDPAEVTATGADLVVARVTGDGAAGLAPLRGLRRDLPSLPALLVVPRDAAPEGAHPELDIVLGGPPEPALLGPLVRAALAAGALHGRLDAERERFAALRSSLQDGLSVLGPDGRMLDANDRLAEITGVPRARLIGARPPFDFWPPRLRDAYGRRLRRALEGRATGEDDRVYRRPDGEERHVIVSIAPLRTGSDDTAAFVSTVKDVTARYAAEEDLRRSEEAHRRLAGQQAALARVAGAVAAGEAPEAVYALVAREVASLLRVEAGGVARFEPDGLTATLLGAWTSVDALRLAPGTALPLTGESVTARVRRTGRPARIDDYGSLPPGVVGGGHAPRRSSVAAPVRIGGRLWGTVGALSDRPAGLAPDAEDRLADFAALVALGIAGAEARTQLTTLAETDALTGLANRRAFDECLAAALSAARGAGRPLSLILVDIDHFKRVNDTFGHEAGDGVIRELALRLRGVSRSGDLVARIGGEEFAWVVEGAGRERARAVAARLRAAVACRVFPLAGRVTISAGVAEAAEGDDDAALRRRADAALYDAKRRGRNRVEVAAPAPGRHVPAAVSA
jgi:diguanylate cyclase (GGDEF)-like protein/PAS domain S-box-containing protein